MYLVRVESTLERDGHRAMRHVVDGIRAGVQHAVDEGIAEAIRTKQYTDRSGKLTKSLRATTAESIPLGAEAEMVAGEKYASFVEGGTKPHIIEARRAQALRWEDAEGVHFARSVQHPGTSPRPFMGQAYLKAERVLERDLDIAAARAEQDFH